MSRARFRFATYALVVFLVIISPLSHSDDKPLIVGSEQNYPPFALGLTDDTADGFTVELWRAVAAESRLNSTIRVMPFHDILQDFKAAKIDVLINLAESDERRQFADFTVPHVIVHGAIFVRKGEDDIHTEADLNGKSIIVLNADLAHDYALSKGWRKQLVLVDTSEAGFQLLASGQYDVLLLSKLAGKQTLEKLGLANIEALPIKVGFSQKFSFAVHKGNAELLAKINEGLALTKVSGVYDKLYEKWFGVYEEKNLQLLLIKYLAPIVGIFLLIIGLSLYRRSVERKQAIQALQESESRFRDLFENAPLPYQSLDINGRFLYVNEAWVELVGCHREQAIDQLFSDFVSASSKSLLATTLGQLKNSNARGSMVLELMCREASEKHLVAVKWHIARDNKQNFQRTHCILTDITEQHRAEQALKENQVALAAAHADLVQFTYIAAHHLQEPTRRLATFVQRLQSQLAEIPELNKDVVTSLNFIEQSALRQRALVRDIQLYLAVIRPIGVVEQNSVAKILAKVLRHHAQLIDNTHAIIEYDDLPSVHFDQPRLYDIFNILLDNALHYRHPERTLRIQISGEAKGRRVYYRIADNGIGIPADCRERVFLVFERLQINNNPESTGIGLAIVQRIIKSCHGSVSLDETPNGGTTVLFDLPE
ncbi:MAG: transporter substrate-binding domain-containing protein [Methylococcales bacterium]